MEMTQNMQQNGIAKYTRKIMWSNIIQALKLDLENIDKQVN